MQEFLDAVYDWAVEHDEFPSNVFAMEGLRIAQQCFDYSEDQAEVFLDTVDLSQFRELDQTFVEHKEESRNKLAALGMSERDFL